ncbi:hypothetical protein WMY93_029634 [Mugilogobius chulae]|uniref:Rho GTPase-activating protein 29 n=1 Tax=Mugilogobius chulae TaxID=88201 RepID=A0AAW0MP52_9GOBI
MNHSIKEHQDCLHQAVHERLGELLRVLKAIINKHQSLNSVDILSTAGTVIASVKERKHKIKGGLLCFFQLFRPSPPVRPEEVDRTLQRQDSGVDSALLYAKAWSKYTKELLAWVEKRLNMDIECAKSYAKMAESAKALASQQEFMPFREIYTTAFKNDIEYSQLVLQTAAVLQTHKFIQPLVARKNELDKLRKEVKEQWQRELKKMNEADSALKKARLLQAQRQEEYEKAKVSTSRLEEEQNGAGGGTAAGVKQLEKRRRLEEEALQKVTVNWFQLQQAQVVSLPVNHQSLCENAKLYEPGQRYIDFVKSLPTDGPRLESHSFESSSVQNTGRLQEEAAQNPSTGTMSSADDLDEREPPSPSDNDHSAVSSCVSPCSLNDIVIETASSPGPFRNAQMSKAAQTHKLRKLRAPSKCRECDGLVVFHGAECEECSLACHKKCLETLAIQCGHKKLQGRLHLFGIDFTQAAKNSPDGIPFIIRKCTSEIENRALNIKGIYRVNGAKSRVEKLCQAFENGKDLVELSELYPHDISNVLKLYLRQLPEPLILFRYYNDFIGLAKESQRIIVEDLEAMRLNPTPVPSSQVSVELNRVLFKIKDLLRQLPPTHYKTLQFLIQHLHRVSEKSEENKMTASNLGIIFGPTLIKPRQADAEVSLSSLVDYPYQALIVELLIRHYQMIFDTPLSPLGSSSPMEIKGRPRVLTREKGQQLSRHSKSMGDIKEQSSKVYKRHSSIIPSSHLLAEVQESLPSLDGSDFEPGDEVDSLNGALSSSVPDVPKTPGLSRSHHVTVTRVQLRHQRNKLPSSGILTRPVSMPPEQIQADDIQDERSCSQSIEEVDETETVRVRSCGSTHYRRTFIDTQTLRRTWDKQYKHHDVSTRTVKIVSTESAIESKSDSPQTVGIFTRVDLIPSRAPRTLQPPPGTFYKPPSGNKVLVQKLNSTNSAEDEDDDDDDEEEEELGLEIEVSVDEPLEEEEDNEVDQAASSESLSPSPEELGPNQTKPAYPRLRTRRLQEVEHREAHFV